MIGNFFLVECNTNQDCPDNRECISNHCLDPCKHGQCGTGASCLAISHVATCSCPKGMQGNPYVKCVSIVCSLDSDCAATQRCHLASHQCEDVCLNSPCADHAECRGENHKPVCFCTSPFIGNGHVYCGLISEYLKTGS